MPGGHGWGCELERVQGDGEKGRRLLPRSEQRLRSAAAEIVGDERVCPLLSNAAKFPLIRLLAVAQDDDSRRSGEGGTKASQTEHRRESQSKNHEASPFQCSHVAICSAEPLMNASAVTASAEKTARIWVANQLANEPFGTARYWIERVSIARTKMSNWSTRLATARHPPA